MIDERLTNIENQKQNALNQSNSVYDSLLKNNTDLYNQQKQYADTYEQTQNDILDKQLAFNQEQIEKQKKNAQENFETESKKARNDYEAFKNPYGYESERLAQAGLNNSGVSETSKLGGYNAYQNRLATANKVMQAAFTQYDSDLNQARLDNDVQKAQNALSKLQMQLEYSQKYYDNNANISMNRLNANQNIDNTYYNRYQDTVNQINYEKEQAEKRRQYEEQMAYQRQQDALAQSNWEREFALSKQASSSYSGSGSSSSGGYELTDNSSMINPYTNTVNPDAKKGTFSNGYQPNNINGNALSKSKYKVSDIFSNSAYGKTGISLSNQSIWQIGSNYYVWDGSINDYINVTSKVNYALKHSGPVKW